jgi:putative ABC transport system permease protein
MPSLIRRLGFWLRHRQVQDDLAAEMEFHRAAHQRTLERDGLSPREAADASRRAMGNVTLAREDARGVWLAPWLESVGQDAAYAVRALWRQPGFTLLAMGALTAGIGLNTSLFSVYAALAMKPWAVREPDRVVRVLNMSTFDLRKRAGGGPQGLSLAEVGYFARQAKTLSGLVMSGRRVTVTAGDADASAYWVGGTYFSLLGVEMAAGRGFVPEEDRPELPAAVAVISYGYWQRQFGGDPAVVGREVRFDDVPFTIVGVASRQFAGTVPDRVDAWLPLAAAALLRPEDGWVKDVLLKPANCCSPVAARLAPGVTVDQARAELNVLSRQFRGLRPALSDVEGPGDQGGIELTGTQVFANPKDDGSAIFVPLFAGLTLVLLLACANVGNLLLARAAARRREIAVRLSLGASRLRLIRQLLTESFVLACVSGAAGIIVAGWLPAEILRITLGNPTALQLDPDGAVLAFTLGISAVSCLLFGLAPALHGTRRDAIAAFKDGSALPGARFSLRTLLLSVQVAAVVVLLVSAGVMVRSARHATDRAMGAVARDLSAVSLTPPVRGYDAARTRALALEIERALDNAIASGAVALTSTAPLASGNIKGSFRLPGQDETLHNGVFEVSPGYFQLTGLVILEGRGFTAADTGRPLIVINERMAKEFWPGKSPVGQRIVCTPPESGWNMPGELEIIGVVRDSYMTDLGEVQPTLFQPMTHRALPQILATSRSAADAAVAAAVRIDPRLRTRVLSLESVLAPRLRSARVGAAMAGSLGILALGFACVGMFGVFAYWVRQRTQEIGVRMALGAQSSDVIRLVLGTTARAVLIGLAVGLVASVAGARLLRSFLFGLSGIDLVTYAAVAAILVVASLVAAWLPARRATRIDPLVALRYE